MDNNIDGLSFSFHNGGCVHRTVRTIFLCRTYHRNVSVNVIGPTTIIVCDSVPSSILATVRSIILGHYPRTSRELVTLTSGVGRRTRKGGLTNSKRKGIMHLRA